MDTFSDRIANIEAEGAYAVMAKAQALEKMGRDIIHMEIGQPDFETFELIREAGKKAIDEGFTKYNPSAGYADLREEIASQARVDGHSVSYENVVVGPGAKPGIVFPLLALLHSGDEVLYPDPGFPTYRTAIELAHGIPVPVPLVEKNSFAFDMERLEALISPKTRLCIINSPSNPTGGIARLEDLRQLAELACKHDFWIMSDEIYSRLVYDGAFPTSIGTLENMADRTITVNGFSKTYAMTGWRLGYAIMPVNLAEKVSLLLMHAVGCTAGFTQKAGIVALKDCEAEIADVVDEYRKRRDLISKGLNAIAGFYCQKPEGAFYAFPNVKEIGLSSKELASRLLEEAGVACLAGTDFGANGEGYLRFTYATSRREIRKALERIAEFVSEL